MWNETSQVYQLDFGGRVTQESAKNFQIEFGGKQVCAVCTVCASCFVMWWKKGFLLNVYEPSILIRVERMGRLKKIHSVVYISSN